MPLVEVSVTKGALSPEDKVKMANDVCDLLLKAIPGLRREAISVIFHEHPGENWVVGGVTVKELIERTKGKR
jgi:4-oxalocrotonate tautomerase family enzyme